MSGNSEEKNIMFRRATEKDAPVLAEFNLRMARETEDKVLDHQVVLAGVRGLFAHPTLGFYLVAESDGVIVGSLMITPEWTDWRNGVFWWIQSLYVIPEWRRRGVYRRLYETVKQHASEDSSVRGFRLYVDKHNQTAQEVYSVLGMQNSDYLLFEEIL